MGNEHDELLAKARRGAARALDALERDAQDLSRPWPRVAHETLAEGRAAAERVAAALRTLGERAGGPGPCNLSRNLFRNPLLTLHP